MTRATAGRRLRGIPLWFAALALAYLYCFPYYPKIHSANELPRAYLVQAMVEEGRFAIDTGVKTWGATADVSPAGGHQYSNKAPGSSMLAVPVYAAVRLVHGAPLSLATTVWLARVFTGILPTLLFLWLLRGFLRRYVSSQALIDALVATYGLGSMAMTYSVLFISHQLSAICVGLAWMWLVRIFDTGPLNAPVARWRALRVGLAVGAAPLVDYQAAFVAVPLAGWAVWELRRWPWQRALRLIAYVALGALLPIALLLYYHNVCFGAPLRTGYDASESFAHFHQQGFLGITALRAEAFWGSTWRGDNGLFTLAPWLLAFPFGLVLLWRQARRAEVVVTAAIVAVMLLFVSSINFWRGGWTVGPRYITVMLPFMLPAIAVTWQWALARAWAASVVLASAVVGICIYALATALFPHFPERFGNPLYDVLFALLRDGAVAPNPVRALGVTGAASLLPYVCFVTLAFGLPWWQALRDHAVGRSVRLALRATALGVLLASATLWSYRYFPRATAADRAAYHAYVRGAVQSAQGPW